MKLLQTITLKLICLGMLIFAVALILYPSSTLYEMMVSQIPGGQHSETTNQMLRILVGIVGCAIAIWGLIPLSNGRSRSKTISFPDAQGTTTVHLESIEKTLNQEIARQPEIKRVSVEIEPADDNRRVRLVANVVIRKGSGISTRDIYTRMKTFIVEEARNILGPDEIAGLDLNVEGIIPDKRAHSAVIEEVPVDFEKKTGDSLPPGPEQDDSEDLGGEGALDRLPEAAPADRDAEIPPSEFEADRQNGASRTAFDHLDTGDASGTNGDDEDDLPPIRDAELVLDDDDDGQEER